MKIEFHTWPLRFVTFMGGYWKYLFKKKKTYMHMELLEEHNYYFYLFIFFFVTDNV